jgi:hypothetical protein
MPLYALWLLSIKSMSEPAGAFVTADAAYPYPEKMQATQSKNQGEKKRGHRLPGVAS